MRHFFRSHLAPADVVAQADAFFPALGLRTLQSAPRARVFEGIVGTPEVPSRLRLQVRSEGGHYTMVEAHTDQVGESRIDRNVKQFFVALHRQHDERHSLEAAY